MPSPLLTRRALLAAPALLIAPAAAALSPTPRQAEGPFYPRRPPADRDADLSIFNGGRAPGPLMELVGVVGDVRGATVARAEVEIWHCDPNGVYAHVGFRTDPHFQGFGAVRAGGDGAFRFRTTWPGLYPGRTRHIHLRARRQGGRWLTTQVYFPGEPGNARDGLLRRADDPQRLIAPKEAGSPPRFRFDPILA